MNMKLIDGYSRPKFYSVACIEWLSFRVELLSSVMFGLFLIFLLILPNGTIDPSKQNWVLVNPFSYFLGLATLI